MSIGIFCARKNILGGSNKNKKCENNPQNNEFVVYLSEFMFIYFKNLKCIW